MNDQRGRRSRQEPIPEIPIGADLQIGSIQEYSFGIPDWLFMDKSVSWGAKIIFAVIARFSKTKEFPNGGTEFIQEMMGISRSELFKRLNELESAGFINRRLSDRHARRVSIMPRFNKVQADFYAQECDALDLFHRFRKANCLQTETLQKIVESPNGDCSTVVLSPNGDSTSLQTETLHHSPNKVLNITGIYEEGKTKNFFPSLQDQNQPQRTTQLQGTEETRIEKPIPPPAANFDSQSTSQDCQLDESIEVFIANAYRQSRGAKLTKSELRKLTPTLQEEERSWGPEALRGALWNYLAEATDWLRTEKWPLRNFLRQVSRYLPADAAGSSSASKRGQWYTGYPRTPQNASEAVLSEKDPKQTSQYYLDTWNAIVDNSPVQLPLADFIGPKVSKAIQSTTFRDRFEEICRKCRDLNNAGQSLTFEWLFAGYEPGWQKILAGQYNWALTKKASGGAGNSSDAWLEKIAREEQNK